MNAMPPRHMEWLYLDDLPRWVAWKHEARDGKATKVPYSPLSGRRAASDNPADWSDHEAACIACERLQANGVGFMLGAHADIAMGGIDLDTCRNPETGTLAPWAQEVIERFGSYTEVSPSGTGVKIFFGYDAAALPEIRKAMGTETGKQFKQGTGEHPPSIELYLSGRYFAVTRQPLPNLPAAPVTVPTSAILWLVREAGPTFAKKPSLVLLDTSPAGKDSSRSGKAFRAAVKVRSAGGSYEDFKAELEQDPDTAAWLREKGLANGEREARRAWDRAADRKAAPEPDHEEWPEPLDFLADAQMTGVPELKPEHIPEAIAPFVFDTAARMGVDPAAVALSALVSLASVISDDWAIQPKQHDDTWTENPRIWGAIVGDPSMLKSPIVKEATRPIDKLETEARKAYDLAMMRYRAELKAWKDGGSDPATEPKMPRLTRYLVENTTTEAISEALRDDFEAKQHAPARKVLIRQDEMSEWIAGFDRYRSGGKGGADRGAYLRLYNGGRFTVDRVNRGTFAVPNWSACVLGGIQPGPIRAIARDAADDGLLQRFCYCVPAKQGRGEDRVPNSAALERYRSLFPALGALQPSRFMSGEPRPVILHGNAHKGRLEILDLAEALASMPDTSDRMKSALGKWPGLWARLVLIFHLIEVADARVREASTRPMLAMLAEGTAQRATSYMRDVLLPHLLRAEAIMFATEQTGHARWIAGYILAKGQNRITIRDLVQAYRPLRAPEHRRELLEVMAGLEAMGWVRAEPQKDVARSPTGWDINPKIHEVFASRARREHEEREAAKKRIAEMLSRVRRGAS